MTTECNRCSFCKVIIIIIIKVVIIVILGMGQTCYAGRPRWALDHAVATVALEHDLTAILDFPEIFHRIILANSNFSVIGSISHPKLLLKKMNLCHIS